MSFVNIKESTIVGSIGSIAGKMQGELASKVANTVVSLEDEFANGSPSPEKLKQLQLTRNNLVKRTQSFKKRLDKLEKIPDTLLKILPALKVLLKILMTLPIPTAVPPGIGVPIAITNKYADILHKIKELIKQLDQDAKGVKAVLNIEGGIDNLINSLDEKLSKLDLLVQFASIENEIKKLPESEQKEKGFLSDDGEYISTTLMPILLGGNEDDANKLLSGLDVEFSLGGKLEKDGFGKDSKYYYRGPNGDLYELAIIEDTKSPTFAKKRYAVAKTTQGIVVLKGQSSFSADTDILLDEIKFRIDKQLP